MDEVLSKLLALAQQAGPFAAVVMTFLWWRENSERKAESENARTEKAELQKRFDALQDKFDQLVGRFVSLAGDTGATLKDWRDLLKPNK